VTGIGWRINHIKLLISYLQNLCYLNFGCVGFWGGCNPAGPPPLGCAPASCNNWIQRRNHTEIPTASAGMLQGLPNISGTLWGDKLANGLGVQQACKIWYSLIYSAIQNKTAQVTSQNLSRRSLHNYVKYLIPACQPNKFLAPCHLGTSCISGFCFAMRMSPLSIEACTVESQWKSSPWKHPNILCFIHSFSLILILTRKKDDKFLFCCFNINVLATRISEFRVER
jgi:hypothetical protein